MRIKLTTVLIFFVILTVITAKVVNGPLVSSKTKLTESIFPMILKDLNRGTLLGLIMQGYRHENVSLECQTSLRNLSDGLMSGNMNAAYFVDASAKVPAGMGMGSVTILGAFDQCLELDYPAKNDSLFQGKYCSVYFRPDPGHSSSMASLMDLDPNMHGEIKMRSDVCLPSTCDENDIEVAIKSTFKKKLMGMVKMDIRAGKCETRDYKPLTNGQKTVLVIFGVLCLFILFGTLWDVSMRLRARYHNQLPVLGHNNDAGIVKKTFLCFSVMKNGEYLLKTSMGSDSLGCLNGIKFMTTTWVIFMHSYAFMNVDLMGNLMSMGDLSGTFWFQIVNNGTMNTDAFFVMSGLLVTYIAMKDLKRDGKINWFRYVIHRYFRLTPAFAASALFCLLYPKLGSGPTYLDSALTYTFENCEKYWWYNVLYINNFQDMRNMCLPHTWYLAVDMQFYLIAPFILILLYKKPIIGLVLNFVLLVTSMAVRAFIVYTNEYPPSFALDQGLTIEKLRSYFEGVYEMPYTRISPYCIGIFLGYYLAVNQNRKLNLSRMSKLAIWCLCIAGNMSVLFGSYEWNNGHPYSNEINTLYAATHRTVWCLGIGWLIITCCTGNGGVANSFLSWKCFVPLAKLTYVAYLIHAIIMSIQTSLLRERYIYTDFNHIEIFFGSWTLSFVLSFFVSLAVEMPFIELDKILFPKRSLKKPQPFASDDHANGVSTPKGVDHLSVEAKL